MSAFALLHLGVNKYPFYTTYLEDTSFWSWVSWLTSFPLPHVQYLISGIGVLGFVMGKMPLRTYNFDNGQGIMANIIPTMHQLSNTQYQLAGSLHKLPPNTLQRKYKKKPMKINFAKLPCWKLKVLRSVRAHKEWRDDPNFTNFPSQLGQSYSSGVL